MSEAGRNIKLGFIFGRQFNAEPFPECCGAYTQVHGDIENPPGGATHQLAHWRTHVLIMKAPQHACARAGMRVLDEFERESRFREVPFMPHLDEEAALVLKIVDMDQQ